MRMRPCEESVKQASGRRQIRPVRFKKGCAQNIPREHRLGDDMSIEVSIAAKSYENQLLALSPSEDGGTVSEPVAPWPLYLTRTLRARKGP